MKKIKAVFAVKFDLVQNLTDLTNLDAENLKKYEENREEYNKKFMEIFKACLIGMFDFREKAWIENVEIEVKDE